MKTILVPTDFSKNALNAVKYAIAYSQETNSKITLFHSYEEPTAPLNVALAGIHMSKQEFRQIAERNMKKLIASLQKTNPVLKLKWVVQPGIGADTIVDYAKDNTIPLIIMGTTGQGAIARALIGSTTSSVIKNVPCTIIAVPPKAKFKGITKVAIATDIEQNSPDVVNQAAAFAKSLRAAITFIYVQDLAIFDAEDALEKMITKLKTQSRYKNISYYVCNDSDVADGLDRFIKKQKPDVLSMITHGWKFPETIWKTSWTDKMSNYTSVPLVIFHTRKPKNS